MTLGGHFSQNTENLFHTNYNTKTLTETFSEVELAPFTPHNKSLLVDKYFLSVKSILMKKIGIGILL